MTNNSYEDNSWLNEYSSDLEDAWSEEDEEARAWAYGIIEQEEF